MATVDAKESLDWWRKFFSCGKSDIFELIGKAILVAATDHPKEFMVKKDLIVQKLCNAHHSLCLESDPVRHNNGGSPKLTSEHKTSSHLRAGVERKKRFEEASETSRLEMAKRKLREGYQLVENAKKRRQIQIIELRDLPKESHKNGRSKKKLRK